MINKVYFVLFSWWITGFCYLVSWLKFISVHKKFPFLFIGLCLLKNMDIYCLVWIESSLFTGIYSESWLLSWKDWFKYKFLPNLLIFSQKLSLSKVAAGKWHPNILWVSMVSIYFWQKDDVMYQITHGILIDFLPACVFYLYITSPGHRRSKCIQIVQKEEHLFILHLTLVRLFVGLGPVCQLGNWTEQARSGQVHARVDCQQHHEPRSPGAASWE